MILHVLQLAFFLHLFPCYNECSHKITIEALFIVAKSEIFCYS